MKIFNTKVTVNNNDNAETIVSLGKYDKLRKEAKAGELRINPKKDFLGLLGLISSFKQWKSSCGVMVSVLACRFNDPISIRVLFHCSSHITRSLVQFPKGKRPEFSRFEGCSK
jgi:hypothetical protein